MWFRHSAAINETSSSADADKPAWRIYTGYGFLLVFYRNFVPNTQRFWYIRLQKCCDLENRVRGPSRSLEMSPCDRTHMTSYWRSIVTMALSCVVSETFNIENVVTLNSGQRSLKVIENYTTRSGTHDFLLTFHSNHRPISHRFRDKRRYPMFVENCTKIANFPTPVYLTPPLKGFPLELCVGAGLSRNYNDGAFRWSKNVFK